MSCPFQDVAHASRKRAGDVSAAFANVFCLKVINVLTKRFQHNRLGWVEVTAIGIKDRQNFSVIWEDDRPHLPLPYLRHLAFWVLVVVVVRPELIEHGAISISAGSMAFRAAARSEYSTAPNSDSILSTCLRFHSRIMSSGKSFGALSMVVWQFAQSRIRLS
jgi:hypothetical protein